MIPFCKTTLGEEEKKAVADCIDSGWVVLGPKSKEFEEKFAEYVGANHAVFVDSGTSALFLALQAVKHLVLPQMQGDPNIFKPVFRVPSLTFTATAEVLIHAGFAPMFGDVGEDLLLDRVDMYSLPVHLLGRKAKSGALIYDSAHRIEKDDMKGSEAMHCYSFYATKNMTTVQGGMIATNSKIIYDWLIKARDHGLDLGTRERYQGKYKQYEVEFVGWRLKGDDLRAVVGLEQLKKLPQATERRNEIVALYNKRLGLSHTGNHVYAIFVKDRERFAEHMFDAGIQTTVHFRPLHLMRAYKDIPSEESLAHTEKVGETIISIPLYPSLSNDDVNYISDKILESNLML